MYADTDTPVSPTLATLSLSAGKVVIVASTDEISFAGNHKVKIVGTSRYTVPEQSQESPAFDIFVDVCNSCLLAQLIPHDPFVDAIP